jgi:arsenate reductase (thioredoxin)
MNILFLCTGNACRSILAEAILNTLAPEGMHAMSAGSHPTGEVHPRSIALLKQKGIPTEGYYSKSWQDLPSVPDIVITVCDNAAGESCPAYLGKAIRAHWGVDDPAKATGSEATICASFESAYSILRKRIAAFLAIDFGIINDDATLVNQLTDIGQLQ